MEEKVIYVKQGQKLSLESRVDRVTNEGYFLISDEDGGTVLAREVVTAEGVRFTTDASKQQFKPDSLHSDVFWFIKELVGGSREDVRRGAVGEYQEVDYISYRDLADGFNRFHGRNDFVGMSQRVVGKVCRAIGLPIVRTGGGYVVVLGEQELRAVESRFEKVSLPK
ncbi:MAG: hypothetical protein HGB11_10320 [Chlorobiales bacterium]|nr:hypothetical protein [Chlorobiales bacterium]